MNILFEIADRDLIFIGLAFVGLIIFAIIIFYIVNKDNKVRPISEEERFDQDDEPVVTKIESPKELTTEQLEAKAELERVFNQMSADLDTKQPAPEVIEDFEREQEENAIISYQELIEQATAKNKLETLEPKTSENFLASFLGEEPAKPISHLVQKDEPIVSQKVEIDTIAHQEETKKFKNSDIISPIFGIQSEIEIVPEKAEAPAPRHAYEEMKVAYESENNNEFLSTLKEFRNNL